MSFGVSIFYLMPNFSNYYLNRHIIQAIKIFHKIAKTNREDMSVAALPFYTGVFVSVTAGYLSIPLVFHRGIVEWFNEKYVTAEMPPVEDLETWLEVGSV